MIKSFIISFKLKNTYRANSIIYSIKQLPFARRILPESLYKNKALKIFGNIIAIIVELCTIFLGKFLYIFFCILAVFSVYKENNLDYANVFMHLFLFLTIIGGIMNTYMFNPTKDKYYAMMIMNMDAKEYTLSNYIYSMLKVFVGFMPFTIVFGFMSKVPLGICILMPLFVVMVKVIFSAYVLIDFKKTKIVKNENVLNKLTWIVIGILLILAYGLPYIGIVINPTIFIVCFIISSVLGTISMNVIYSFDKYKQMYKQILTIENVYAVQNAGSTQTIKETVSKQIELDNDYISNRTGFAFFHDLFVKRHRKILTKAVKKQAVIILFIFAVLFIMIKANPVIAEQMNRITLTYLPYFVFIMYCLNRSSSVTQAMFMNCDHSMLTYRIYRTPKVILGIFKERLKTLIIINLPTALLIGFGLAMVLYLSGGTDNSINYIIIIVSIIAMSIFFSVHYLVMYYLLQPYNVGTEIKSSTYKVVQGLTYFIPYLLMQFRMSTISFGIMTIIFCIAYSLISLVLAYKYAPKTFRLRT